MDQSESSVRSQLSSTRVWETLSQDILPVVEVKPLECIIVVSRSDGELGYGMMSGDHVVMGFGFHEFKITVSDCSLGVEGSD